MRKKFLILLMIKHKILNLHQQDSVEYFPLAWQMLTSRPPLMERLTVVELVVDLAAVTAEEGEKDLWVELVTEEVAGEVEMAL